MRAAFVALLTLGALSAAFAADPLPAGVRVVADGFTWAENLVFDGRGSLFFSDTIRGSIYKTVSTGPGKYSTSTFLTGMQRVLGLAHDSALPTTLYAVGKVNDTFVVIAMNTTIPQQYRVVTTLPKIGNGFRVHDRTGLLYTSSEGNFLPGGGEVFEVNATSGKWRSINSDIWASDGLWIDQNSDMLYVGELVTSRVWSYDLRAGRGLVMSPGLSEPGMLDDFCLSHDSSLVVGCNWLMKRIELFPVNATARASKPLLENIGHPTSARWGVGPGFASTSLFITEGSGVFKFQTGCRVLEYVNAPAALMQAKAALGQPQQQQDEESAAKPAISLEEAMAIRKQVRGL